MPPLRPRFELETVAPGAERALTLAVVAIDGWHRVAISLRTVPGTYVR